MFALNDVKSITHKLKRVSKIKLFPSLVVYHGNTATGVLAAAPTGPAGEWQHASDCWEVQPVSQ